MGQVLALAMPFFGLIAIGYVAARLRPLPRDGLAWMNAFIVYVALPALFFQLLAQTPVEKLASWGFVFATTLGTYVTFVLAMTVASALSAPRVVDAMVQGLAGAYGNIGYMGPGLAIAALGPEAVVPVALIFCFDNTLHFTLAPLLAAVGDGKQNVWRTAREIVVRITTHPFIVSTAAGVLAAVVGFEPPEVLARLLDFLANAAAPCALFAMGVTVALAPRIVVPASTLALVPLKLIVHPLIVWLLLGWIGEFDRVWVFSAVLLAALPTATNVFVIAQQYDAWVEGASSMVVLTTLASVITVTALLYVMTTGLLPIDPFPSR